MNVTHQIIDSEWMRQKIGEIPPIGIEYSNVNIKSLRKLDDLEVNAIIFYRYPWNYNGRDFESCMEWKLLSVLDRTENIRRLPDLLCYITYQYFYLQKYKTTSIDTLHHVK